MIQALIGPVTGLDKFIEDKDQKAKLAHEIATMSEKHAQQIALAQIEVNKLKLHLARCSRRLATSSWMDVCVCLPIPFYN